MQEVDSIYTMPADVLAARLSFLDNASAYDRSRFEVGLVRAYRLGRQTEAKEHQCPICGKSWKCSKQRLGESCVSMIDGGRCPSCNWAWRMGTGKAGN